MCAGLPPQVPKKTFDMNHGSTTLTDSGRPPGYGSTKRERDRMIDGCLEAQAGSDSGSPDKLHRALS